MIKARSGFNVYFGLTPEDLERLQQGIGLVANLKTMGIPGNATIFFTETEEQARENIALFVDGGPIYSNEDG